MDKVTAILAEKGSRVFSVAPDTTVVAAAELMNEHHVGATVVKDGDRLVGMFTERDVLRRVVVERRDPAVTRVGEVMSRDVICATPETTIEEARNVMKEHRIRHLPVIDPEKGLIGLISIGDLNAWRLEGQEKTIYLLKEHVYGLVR